MNESPDLSSKQRLRLRLARTVLFFGLYLFVGGQFVPAYRFEIERTSAKGGNFITSRNREGVEMSVKQIMPDIITIARVTQWPNLIATIPRFRYMAPQEIAAVSELYGMALVYLALPFLAGWLARARALLWTARLFMLFYTGYYLLRMTHTSRYSLPHVEVQILWGYWIFGAVPVVCAIGLWLVPKVFPTVPCPRLNSSP